MKEKILSLDRAVTFLPQQLFFNLNASIKKQDQKMHSCLRQLFKGVLLAVDGVGVCCSPGVIWWKI
jgi:hypothetical protein